MNSPTIGQPVARAKVVFGGLVLAVAIAGVVLASEALRYPHATSAASTAPTVQQEPVSDPRAPLECEEPIPREGQIRSTDGGDEALRRVTSSELYDCPQTFDGSQVRYRGEVIGAVLQRNGGAWVHLNDDIYARDLGPLPAHRDYRGGNGGVGVFVPDVVAQQITHIGGPQERGDIVEVIGRFHRVDQATGEVAILRAASGTITTAGGPLERPLLPARRVAALAMAALMTVTVIAERFLRTRD